MDNSLPMLRFIVDYGEARWESVPLVMRSRSIAGMLDDTIKTAKATAERFGIDGAEDTLSDKTEMIRARNCYSSVQLSGQRDIADPERPGVELADLGSLAGSTSPSYRSWLPGRSGDTPVPDGTSRG